MQEKAIRTPWEDEANPSPPSPLLRLRSPGMVPVGQQRHGAIRPVGRDRLVVAVLW